MHTPSIEPLLLSVPEAAAKLNIGRAFFYQMVARNEIATITLGRRRLVPVASLERFIEQRSAA